MNRHGDPSTNGKGHSVVDNENGIIEVLVPAPPIRRRQRKQAKACTLNRCALLVVFY